MAELIEMELATRAPNVQTKAELQVVIVLLGNEKIIISKEVSVLIPNYWVTDLEFAACSF